jgi:soluble lytic murein transglycosylase-like protein
MLSRHRPLIERLAATHGLNPRLVEAFVFVESSDQQEAISFEPHIYDLLLTKCPHLSPTERMQQATSWGLLQVMGMVARERGFTRCCVELCRDPEVGLRVGMSHLAWLVTRAKDQDEMIRAYNAGLGGARKGRGGAYLQKVQRMYATLT